MSILKKRFRSTKLVDSNTESIVYDFMNRAPFWNYRTINYQEYEPFKDLTPVIDSYLEKLFEGQVDSGNSNTADNTIADMARQAERDLNRQLVDHRDTIKKLDIRNKADRKAFEDELDLLNTELQKNARLLIEVEDRLAKEKFIGGVRYA